LFKNDRRQSWNPDFENLILAEMKKRSFYIVNGITLYRLVAAPVLIVLVFTGDIDIFKWLLPVSFFTDMIDGYLARKFKVISVMGTKLDSIADDLTVAAGIVGLFVLKLEFIHEELAWISILLALFLIQTLLALIKYRRLSGFHTYSAKVSALLQGTFLILIFLLKEPVIILFYAAAISTTIDLLEEITLIFLLPKWEADVKGVYWVMRRKLKRNRQ
jgi:phosphatidylglycerophosphate synthase